jgi:hypothetical protein
MFRWVKTVFGGPDSFSTYSPRQRKIFSYFTGKGTVQADPMVLFKRVADKGQDIDTDKRVSQYIDRNGQQLAGAREAHENLMSNLRWVFSVEEFDKGGLTEAEVVSLFDCFMSYCEELKKNSKTQQITSPPSEPSLPTSPKSQTTDNTLASGSTVNDPSTKEQPK